MLIFNYHVFCESMQVSPTTYEVYVFKIGTNYFEQSALKSNISPRLLGWWKKTGSAERVLWNNVIFREEMKFSFFFLYLPTWLLKGCPWIGHELPLLQTTIWGPFRKGEVSLRIEDLRQLSKLSGKPKHLKKEKNMIEFHTISWHQSNLYSTVVQI